MCRLRLRDTEIIVSVWKSIPMRTKGQYILEGKTPVACDNFLEWSIWMGTTERKVDLTQIANVEISTVYTGLDLSDAKPPKVFETLIGTVEDVQLDPQVAEALKRQFNNHVEKACTWDEAQLMHNVCIERVKTALAAAERNLSRKAERDNGSDNFQP